MLRLDLTFKYIKYHIAEKKKKERKKKKNKKGKRRTTKNINLL